MEYWLRCIVWVMNNDFDVDTLHISFDVLFQGEPIKLLTPCLSCIVFLYRPIPEIKK